MAKRKNNSTPRRKRMKQPLRLQADVKWIPTYTGKNLVRGYARNFGLDLLCAVKELEMLGHSIDPNYKAALKRSLEDRAKQSALKREQKKKSEEFDDLLEQDEYFFYIAGYTPGGVPFGITWDEIEQEEAQLSESNIQCESDDERNDDFEYDLDLELDFGINSRLDYETDELPF